jgi:hypothetical protein
LYKPIPLVILNPFTNFSNEKTSYHSTVYPPATAPHHQHVPTLPNLPPATVMGFLPFVKIRKASSVGDLYHLIKTAGAHLPLLLAAIHLMAKPLVSATLKPCFVWISITIIVTGRLMLQLVPALSLWLLSLSGPNL